MIHIPRRSGLHRFHYFVFTVFILQAIGLASSAKVDSSNKEEIDDYCIDRDLSCQSWAQYGECRKKASSRYMEANCAASCNFCNPMLERWELPIRENDDDELPLTRKYMEKHPIYHGVAQKTNFSESPFTKDTIDFLDGPMPADEYYQLRVTDILEAMKEYLKFLYADEASFVSREGFRVHRRIPFATMKTYSPADIENVPYGVRAPQLESCINKHPNCALWAALGYCDSSEEAMLQMCSPVCQSCDLNIPLPHAITVQPSIWSHLPYNRMDLHGILETINEDRIITRKYETPKQYSPTNIKLEYRDKTTKNTGEKLQYLNTDFMDIKTYRIRRTEKDREIYRRMLKLNGTAAEFSSVMTISNMLFEEDCQALLDTVRFGVGMDANDETAKDGFPKTSTDFIFNDQGDKVVKRQSSRAYVFPSIKNKDGAMKYSNALERLINKAQLMTGIHAVEKVESPIIFEKFEPGDFMKPARHFRAGMLNSELHLFSIKDVINATEGKQYEEADQKPDMMENPRIFGLIIFLNGSNTIDEVENLGGVYFPHFANKKFHPLKGSAVLFPTVASLIEQEFYHESPPARLLDLDLELDGDSFLAEDLYTTFGHEPVTQGTKYTVTLFFRRYAYSERTGSGLKKEEDF